MATISTRTKLLIAAAVIVVLFVGIGVLLTAGRGTEEPEAVQETPLLDLDTGLVGDVDFADSQSLELVQAGPLHPRSPLLFVGPQVAYQDVERQLYIDETPLEELGSFVAEEVYYTAGGSFLIDGLTGVAVRDVRGQVQPLPSDVVSMTPYRGGYRYLSFNNETSVYSIKETDNVLIGRDQEPIGELSSSNGFFEAQIRTIADVTYVFFFAEDGETVEIWQFDGGTVRKIRDLEGVSSFEVFENFVLFTDLLETPTDVTDYKMNLLDLNDPARPFLQGLNWTRALGQSGVYGDARANRCALSGETTLYCLAKQVDVPHTFADYKDVLFTYDLETRRIEYPYPTITFSASRVYTSPTGEVYVNLQDTGELYKFVD